MTRSKERQPSPGASADESSAAAAATSHVPSPTRSDRSSDSEGKPVREKLKETRIDAQGTSEATRTSDEHMPDVCNGDENAAASVQSTSGSEGGRGRLRRKRSAEEFEEDNPEPKKERHHARKRSREVTSPPPELVDVKVQPIKSSVSRIDEHDGDEKMTGTEKPSKPEHSASNGRATPPVVASDKEEATTSPKNKRTREQASRDEPGGLDEKIIDSKEGQGNDKSNDEPKSKRPKDDLLTSKDAKVSDPESEPEPEPRSAIFEGIDLQLLEQVPPGSGFANSSATSPFASLSPKSESTKVSDNDPATGLSTSEKVDKVVPEEEDNVDSEEADKVDPEEKDKVTSEKVDKVLLEEQDKVTSEKVDKVVLEQDNVDSEKVNKVDPEEVDPQPYEQMPPCSGFAKSPIVSPIADSSPKPESATAKKPISENLPQTSDDKFKASGFGSFAASSASPFGAVGASVSKSPFAAAPGGSKLSTFASPSKSSSPAPSGFGALGSSSAKTTSSGSALGGAASSATAPSPFGGSLGQGGFGGLGGSKGGLSSFATPGSSTISGLSSKPARPFGAAATGNKEEADGDDHQEGDDNDDASENGETVKSKPAHEKRPNFVPTEGKYSHPTLRSSLNAVVETGEEGEETLLSGRGKLYAYHDKTWTERGIGGLKLNITKDSPKKGRLILRADGTHRLLLNAPITKELSFGDSKGKVTDTGKIIFTAPNASGVIETLLLKVCLDKGSSFLSPSDMKQVKAEKGIELCEAVHKIKAEML